MSEKLLPKPPIEVVRANSLSELGSLLKRVHVEKEEELQEKAQRNDLENAIANIQFINSEVSPLVKEFFQRRNIGLTFGIERVGFKDKLDGWASMAVEPEITYNPYNSGSFSLRLQFGSVFLDAEDMPQAVQRVWDSEGNGYNPDLRRLLREFGSLTREEIVFRFGNTANSFE